MQPVLASADPQLVAGLQSFGRCDVQAADHHLDFVLADRWQAAAASRTEAASAICARDSRAFECLARPHGKGLVGRSAGLAAVLAMAKANPQRRAGHPELDAPAQATAAAYDIVGHGGSSHPATQTKIPCNVLHRPGHSRYNPLGAATVPSTPAKARRFSIRETEDRLLAAVDAARTVAGRNHDRHRDFRPVTLIAILAHETIIGVGPGSQHRGVPALDQRLR